MDDKTPWFRAKRYGWGWGLPLRWQGWAVLGAYALLQAAGVALFPPSLHMTGFLAWVGLTTIALLAVCAAKGERPGWRWGGR